MGQHRQLATTPLTRPVPRQAPRPRSRLWPRLLPVIVLGGVAMLHVVALARLSELEYEHRRLERLSLEQDMRRAELLRMRQQLVDHSVLSQYAYQHKYVSVGESRPLYVGQLPARHVYWALPGEQTPPRDGVMLGCTTFSLAARGRD